MIIMIDASHEKILSMKFLSYSLLASSLSNMAGLVTVTVTGHPLDTIRVRMQMESRLKNRHITTR